MKMPELSLRSVSCALVSLGLVMVCAAVALWFLFPSFSPTEIHEVDSPAKLGSAVLLSESTITDNALHLYVRDTNKSGNTPVYIGVLNDSDSPTASSFEEAFWSRDGSLFIVNFSVDRGMNSPPVTNFGFGYDFKEHKKLTFDAKELLDKRGGKGNTISFNQDSFRKLRWWDSDFTR